MLLWGSQPWRAKHEQRRRRARRFLSSKQKHYMVMGLVALDVAGILADIFVALISCDKHEQDEDWVDDVRNPLQITGLVISCLFLVELLISVWAFGFSYFSSWFHCFDALIIVVSFTVDLVTHGIVEEIASLVVILRLWRFVKIVEELSLGASERLEEMQFKVEELEKENEELRSELRASRGGEEA